MTDLTPEDRARLRALARTIVASRVITDDGRTGAKIVVQAQIENDIAAALLSAEADGRRKGREEIREEAARTQDDVAQDLNRIGDPGMANHARMMARKIRALPLEAPQDKRGDQG